MTWESHDFYFILYIYKMIITLLIGLLSVFVIFIVLGPKVNATRNSIEVTASPTTPAPDTDLSPATHPRTPAMDIGFNPVSGHRLAVKPGMGNRSAVVAQPLPVDMSITFKSPNTSLPEFNDGAVSMAPYTRLTDIEGYKSNSDAPPKGATQS